MKSRNYERKELITFLTILTIILEILFIIILCVEKESKYLKVSSILIKDNLVLAVVNKDERKIIYNNKILYLNDTKKRYKIEEDRGIVIKKGKKDYYELVISFKTPSKNKTNDILDLVIKKEKFKLIEIFKTIWEGD